MGNLVGMYLLNEGNMGSNKEHRLPALPLPLYHHNIYMQSVIPKW